MVTEAVAQVEIDSAAAGVDGYVQQPPRAGLGQDRGHQSTADAAVAVLLADLDRLDVAVPTIQRIVAGHSFCDVEPGDADDVSVDLGDERQMGVPVGGHPADVRTESALVDAA